MFIYPLLISLLVSYLMIPQVKRIAIRLGAVDRPNKRRINTIPIPSLGGVAIYIGVIIALLLTGYANKVLGVIIGGTLVVIIGVLDDLYELSALTKLFAQITVSSIVIVSGVKVQFITIPFMGTQYLGVLSIPVTLFWIVGVINMINLIDGMDGLAGGLSVIAAATLAVLAYQQGQVITLILAVVTIGATLGFLKYNFNPAEIFMGDTGSMFLGYMLGVISIIGSLKSLTFISSIVPLLALGIPIFDTLFAILRRKISGKPIFKADKGHLHHRLLNLGLSQVQVVIIIYLINVFLGMLAIGMIQATLEQILFLTLSSFCLLFIGLIKLDFFKMALNIKS